MHGIILYMFNHTTGIDRFFVAVERYNKNKVTKKEFIFNGKFMKRFNLYATEYNISNSKNSKSMTNGNREPWSSRKRIYNIHLLYTAALCAARSVSIFYT